MKKPEFSRRFRKAAKAYILQEIKRIELDIEEIYSHQAFKNIDIHDSLDELNMTEKQLEKAEKYFFEQVKKEFLNSKNSNKPKILK